jgi:hypothetical protein
VDERVNKEEGRRGRRARPNQGGEEQPPSPIAAADLCRRRSPRRRRNPRERRGRGVWMGMDVVGVWMGILERKMLFWKGNFYFGRTRREDMASDEILVGVIRGRSIPLF